MHIITDQHSIDCGGSRLVVWPSSSQFIHLTASILAKAPGQDRGKRRRDRNRSPLFSSEFIDLQSRSSEVEYVGPLHWLGM